MRRGALAGIAAATLALSLSIAAASAGSDESGPAASPPTRLPPVTEPGDREADARAGGAAAGTAGRGALFSLPNSFVNHNVSNESGNQAETYTAVEPDNPARVKMIDSKSVPVGGKVPPRLADLPVVP